MNYTTENHGNETVWYPEYARIEVMTQTDPDSVVAKRVQGGWASWTDFFPDESVLHFEAVHILTPAELQAERAGAWSEGCEAGYDWGMAETPNMSPEGELNQPVNPHLPAEGDVAGGQFDVGHPQYARLKVVDGSTTSFPIGERGFCGWHSGVMYYPDVLVERYTPLAVLTDAQVNERLAKVWQRGRDHGARYPYGERGLATNDNPYRSAE